MNSWKASAAIRRSYWDRIRFPNLDPNFSGVHSMKRTCFGLVFTGWLLLLGSSVAIAQRNGNGPVKVFILAGQSNMEGKAPNALLEHQATDSKTKDLFSHLRKDGQWIVRDDAFIKFLERKGTAMGDAMLDLMESSSQ